MSDIVCDGTILYVIFAIKKQLQLYIYNEIIEKQWKLFINNDIFMLEADISAIYAC